MADDILLGVKVQGEQALGFFKSLAAGAQGATQSIAGMSPAFAGIQEKISALGPGLAGMNAGAVGTATAFGLLGAALTAAAGAISLKKYLDLSDTYAQLIGKLKLVTNSAEELATTQQRLFTLAQSTRTDLSATVALYGKFATSTKELGLDQTALLRVVETVNKAITLSGGSAESTNAALIQLGQGLASGTLRGEELNSVLEQTPRLATAIARGLGVTIGQLRQLGQEGKLTGAAVVDALRNQAAAVDADFAKLPATVGQALTVLGNSTLRLVGEFDQTIQGSANVAKGLQQVASEADKATEALIRLRQAKEQNNQVEIQGPPKPGFFDQGIGASALSFAQGFNQQSLSNLKDGRDVLSEMVRIIKDLGVAGVQTFKLVADGGHLILSPIQATATAITEGKDAVTRYGTETTTTLHQARTDWESLKDTIKGLIPLTEAVGRSAQDMGAAVGAAVGALTQQLPALVDQYKNASQEAAKAADAFFASQAKLQDTTKEEHAVDLLRVRVETLRLAKEQGLSAAQTMEKLAEATALASGKTVFLTQETLSLKGEEEKLLEALKVEEDQLGAITRLADTRVQQITNEAVGREAVQRAVEATAKQEIQALQQSLALRREANAPLEEQGQLIDKLAAKQQALVTIENQGRQQRLSTHQATIAALNAELSKLQALQNSQQVQASPKEQQAVTQALGQVISKLAEEKAAIVGIRNEVALSHGEILAIEQKHGQELGKQAQEFIQQERFKTQATLDGIKQRADAELQAIAASQSTLGGQRDILRAQVTLLEAQNAPLEAIIAKKREIIAVEIQLARGAVASAEVQLGKEQDLLNATIARSEAIKTQIELAKAAGNQIGVASLAVDLSKTTEQIERQRTAAAAAGIDFERAKQQLVAMGIEGTAAVKELNHQLELSRAVLTTNDARNIFTDILDAGSFKKAGKILEKESQDLSKRVFTDLLFGKKGSFDEPLISNVNGLFGKSGDVGLLGKIMGAGGKEQGVVWGTAVTDSTQKTLQEKFPLVTKQSIDAAHGIFAEGGTSSGAVFGDNCLTSFKNTFGDGIGGVLDEVFSLIGKAFGSSGGTAGGGSGGALSNVNWSGLVNTFSSWFGGAGEASGSSFNSGFMGIFGDLGTQVDANSVDWSAVGSQGGSAFGGGFLDAAKGILGGMGGGGAGGGSGGGIMGLFGGGGGAGGAGGAGGGAASYLGLAQAGAGIGQAFSQGKYGQGAGGVVGGVIGAYFGGPQGAQIGAQLGQMIGKIFDDVFNKQGRIDKEKDKIIKYFERVFDIDFKKLTEKQAAKGIAEFADASPAALSLGALFSEGLKKGDVQGSTVRFAGQLLGNLKRMGEGAEEVKAKLLELADAANFDLRKSTQQINQFTKETGADALTLGNFQNELQDAKKNLKEYGDTSTLTAAQLTTLAAAHGNTGSQIITYTTLIGGAIDISTKFNEFLDGQQIAQELAANAFLDAAKAAGSTGEAITALSDKIRAGNLSLEEAAIALNTMREAAGLARLELKDLTIDPKKLELMVTVLQSATEGLQSFSAGLTDVLAAGLGQQLDTAGAGARFDEFMNATLRVAVTKAMIGGLIDGLKVETLKPFFTALGAEFTNLVTGAINAEEFGRRIAAIKEQFGPIIDAAKAGFVEVDKTIRDVLTTLGLWPQAVKDTTTAAGDLNARIKDLQDKIKAIDDQLLAIARRKIHVDIDLASKLESIGSITLVAKLGIEAKGLQAEFDLLTAKLRSMGDAAGLSVEQLGEAINLVQQLAANVVAKFQAEKAAIEAALATEIAAIRARGQAIADAIRADFAAQRTAIEARITALEKEKDLIAKAFDERKTALEKELQLAQEFQRVGESIQQTINQLVTSNIAPVSPFAQLSFLQRQAAQLREQLASAKPEDVPALMQQLTALLQQMAQLQTPNSRPSPEFQALFNSIVTELEALKAEAVERGSHVDDIQEQLKQLDIDRNKALDAIDAQITGARAQLDALSGAEQAALAVAAAGIEAEVAAAQAKADAKIEELRVAAAEKLQALADVEKDLLSRQEAVLLSDKDILVSQLHELEKLNITAANLLTITAAGYNVPPENRGNSASTSNAPSPPPWNTAATTPRTNAATGIPQFLWESMQAAVRSPQTTDIARPERVQTAPTRTERRAESEPREAKLVIEVKATVEVTGADGPKDAAVKTARGIETALEAEMKNFMRGDFVDKLIREKASRQIKVEVRS